MLAQISWRNVWRNKVRSLVLISSIALGIWAGVFILAFSWGMNTQYVNIAIKGQISHLQLHQPDYKKDKKLKFTIHDAEKIIRQIVSIPAVAAVSGRTLINGMISSATTGAGSNIIGIDPAKENLVTGLGGHIVEGQYFDTSRHHQIILGERLIKKLHLKLNNKVILTFQDVSGNISAGAFRIAGVFRTHNSTFDEANVYVKASDLNGIVGLDSNDVHEIAVLLKDNRDLDAVHRKLRSMFPALLVEDWQEIAPELRFVIDSLVMTMYLFISIILLALAFGIINTMLMAVLERVRELGILMAIGMNKYKIFVMVMLETFYIALIGGPFGLVLAYGTIHILGKTGINLSAFASGLTAYGMDPIVYPTLPLPQYFNILFMVFVASILSAIYPSFKALRFKPVDAIRKI